MLLERSVSMQDELSSADRTSWAYGGPARACARSPSARSSRAYWSAMMKDWTSIATTVPRSVIMKVTSRIE